MRNIFIQIIRKFNNKLHCRTTYSENQNGQFYPTGALVVRKNSINGSEATRVVDANASANVDKFDADAPIIYSIDGEGPKGEELTLRVCGILIERLNQLGENWSSPTMPEGPERGIDCTSCSGDHTLLIQVTRAINNESLWKDLAQTGSVARSVTEEDLADELFRAIKHKETIPKADRKKIILALDAYFASGLTLPTVVSVFRLKYQDSVRSLGFKAIWVVGPTTAHTSRIDC